MKSAEPALRHLRGGGVGQGLVLLEYRSKMKSRKDPLVNNHYYHIFSRSIAKYEIFNDTDDYLRMLNIMDLYRYCDFTYKYSGFDELSLVNQRMILDNLRKDNLVLVEIVAYCLMPTHIHLILKQVKDGGITKYIGKILNSYTKYFNVKHHRAGPLWASRFKSVLVSNDEQLLHLTRYIHLNPSSAGLIKNPKDWQYSSYREYTDLNYKQEKICTFNDVITILPKEYSKFVQNHKAYQKELSSIKNILIDNYTG